jgi:pimeloyl-ACP methyl ester carboxylesterase
MSNPVRPAAVFVLACLAVAASAAAHEGWVGAADLDGRAIYVRLLLGEAPKLHAPQLGLSLADASVEAEGAALRVSAEGPGEPARIVARRDGEELRGEVWLGERRGPFRARRYAIVEPGTFRPYAGSYELAADRVVVFTDLGPNLGIVDLATGEEGTMWPIPGRPEAFFRGLPLDPPASTAGPALEVEFLPAAGGVRWMESGKPTLVGRPVRLFDDTDVTFTNGAVRLAGTLKRPRSPGPHPAIAIVHGAGSHTRHSHAAIQALYAAHGVAVLAYDKRGSGESQGDGETATFEELSGDAAAAIELLVRDPGIDARRVGLWGHSQGGWLAPLAATRSSAVRFLILVSGTTWRAGPQTSYWTERSLRAAGRPEAEVAAAVAYMRRVVAVADAGGKGWDELAPAVEEARRAPWGESTVLPASREDLLAWQGYAFDPIPVLRRVRVPTLAVWGLGDVNVPPEASARELRAIFQETGVPLRVESFPGADHELKLTTTGNPDDWPTSAGYPAGYFRLLVEWVRGLH